MSFTDKKTNSTQDSNQAFTQHTTPNVPSWISDPAQKMAGNIGSLMAQGPSAFTPTTSALENQVTNAATNFTPASDYSDARDAYGGVGNISADQVQGESLLSNLSDYYNPFKQQITDPVLSDFDLQAGKTRAGQAAQAAAGRAFQGSRYGIQEADTEGNIARARAATEGGLLQNMFTESTGLSAQDAARRQAAATSNQSANLAAAQANQSTGLAKAQGLLGVDTASNAQQLAQLEAQKAIGERATMEQQTQQQYPITFAGQTEGLLSGLDPALFTGSDTSGTGTSHTTGQTVEKDPIGQISKLLAATAAFIPK